MSRRIAILGGGRDSATLAAMLQLVGYDVFTTQEEKPMLGRNIALALGAAVAAAGRAIGRVKNLALPDEHLEELLNHSRGKGKGGPNHLFALHRRIWKQGRPTAQRHWHQPGLPSQVDKLAAAYAKRERKAEKLYRDIRSSMRWNDAHKTGAIEMLGNVISDVPARLNPIYVNRA